MKKQYETYLRCSEGFGELPGVSILFISESFHFATFCGVTEKSPLPKSCILHYH